MTLKKGIIAILGLIIAATLFAACIGSGPAATEVDTLDREGYPITLPTEIGSIISIGPSNTEILVELGFGDQIIATDIWSDGVAGIAGDIAVLDMMALDAEFIIDADPDVIFIAGMTRTQGDDHPLRVVEDAGISVLYIPVATSIAEILEDIQFISDVLDVQERGQSLVASMEAEMAAIANIAETISMPRTVYFEISPAPFMWAVGGGNFQNEMLELVGAIYILADETAWISVSDEMFLMHNPDVILTSVDFLDDPIAEIMARPGWDVVSAVQDGNIFRLATDASSRQSHNIIIALWEMARAIYPEYFN